MSRIVRTRSMTTRRVTVSWLGVFVVLAGFGSEVEGQDRHVGVIVEVATFPASDGGIGASLTGEIGVPGVGRLSARWTDTNAFVSCSVSDAPSECNANPSFWELGVRTGIAVGEKVAPYIGAGAGVYRRTRYTTHRPEIRYLDTPVRDSSLFLAVVCGIDIAVARPLVIRISAAHHEVFDKDLRAVYGHGVRFTGLYAGVGVAVW